MPTWFLNGVAIEEGPRTRWTHRFVEWLEVGGRAYFNWTTSRSWRE